MHVARPLKAAAAAALTPMVAAIAIAGPLAGTAAAAPPKRTQAPTITVKPPTPTGATSASFTWTSPENDNFTCTIDGSRAVNCGSGLGGTYAPSTTFGAGSHTFTVRAKLATGRSKASSASATWRVDLAPPPAPQVFVDQPQFTKNTIATVTWTDVEQGTTFLCAVDNHLFGAATACPTETPTTPAQLSLTGLSQG